MVTFYFQGQYNLSPRQMGPMPPQISPEQAQYGEQAGQFGPSPQPGSQMMLSPQQQQAIRVS